MRLLRTCLPYIAITCTTAVLLNMSVHAQTEKGQTEKAQTEKAPTQKGRSTMDHEMKLMDTNQDGRVTAAEHAAGARKMFETMDANQDGTVTAAEMHATHATMAKAQHGAQSQESGEKSAVEKIKAVDANGDGVLTAAEHAAGSVQMFSKMDDDRDGTLTAVEIRAGHEYLRQDEGHRN